MKDWRFLYNRFVRHLQEIDGFLWDYPKKTSLIRHAEPFLDEFILRLGNTFIDVGANVGAWSIRSNRFYKNIYANEPNVECYKSLLRNISLNKCSNIYAVNQALGDSIGIINQRILSPTILGNQMSMSQVSTVPLDNRFLYDVSLIKIDVEGAALNVIKGATQTIERNHPTLIVEVHNKEESTISSLLPNYKWIKRYRDMTPVGDWLYRENNQQVFLIGSAFDPDGPTSL